MSVGTTAAIPIRPGAIFVLFFVLLLPAGPQAPAGEWKAIPLNPEQAYADTSELAPVCERLYQVIWPKALESPEKFTCRAGIYGGELIVRAATDRPVTDKPVKSCPSLQADGFGVMLDTARNLSGFHVLLVDFSGKAKVCRCYAAGYWTESRLKVATTVSKTGGQTSVLARLALKEIGVAPGRGDVWGVFCMRWGLDDKGEPTTCVGNRPVTSLHRSLHYVPTPRHFEPFVIGSAQDGVSLTRGNLAKDEIFAENRFAWTYLRPPADGEAALRILFRRDATEQVVKKAAFRYRKGEPAVVNVPYACPEDGGSMTFLVEAGGQTLYRSTYPVLGNPGEALASREGGFEEARVEKQPDPRLGGGRILTWPQSLHGPWMVEQNGIPAAFAYDYEEWLKYLKGTDQITILAHPGHWGRDDLTIHAPAFRRHRLTCALMPTATKDVAPFKEEQHLQFLPDPKVRQAYLDALTEALTQYPDVVKYVFVGDELTEGITDSAVALWAKRKAEYPLIREINEDVEKRFGSGRYGIPAHFNDDRFKWLAFRRWVADFVERLCREVVAKARAIKPELLFISPDPQYGSRAQYFETWSGVFDIATHQAAEAERSPFDCKVLKDLARAPHVWPCPHLPSYGKAYAPNEIRDILSECFMAGADGLHFWPVAERDNMVRPFEVDSPGATQMLMPFGRICGEGLKPRHGKAQVAVLYANDSYCASGWPEPYQVRTAYEGLGPGLGAEFKLVGDLGVERGHDRLEDFKICVVPWAEIERRSVVEKILAAVKNGLLLVVHHPGAFSLDADGSDTSGLVRQFLGGASLVPAEAAAKKPNAMSAADCDFLRGMKYSFTYKGKPFTFRDLPQDTQIIMRYPDEEKTVAAVLVPVGKGSVIWMGGEVPLYGGDYAKLYRRILAPLGIPVDQPGWRIRLPLEFRRAAAKGVFYTGNYYGLEFSIPQITHNVYLPGTYRYSLPPDAKGAWSAHQAPKDLGNKEPIPFAEGALTDRPRDGRNGVKYTQADAFHVDFDLAATVPLKQVDVYAAGYVPDLELFGSADGREFAAVAKLKGAGEVAGVVCCSLAPDEGQKQTVRHVRLSVGARPAKKDLVIAEVDIIGPDGAGGEPPAPGGPGVGSRGGGLKPMVDFRDGVADPRQGLNPELFDPKKTGSNLWIDHTSGYLVPKLMYYDAHPEYYAQRLDGQRIPKTVTDAYVHLCLSNPEVRKIATERLLGWIRLQPEKRYFCVTQGDGMDWCQCEKCRAMDVTPGNYSDRLLQFVNPMARAVRQEFPDKILLAFAYCGTDVVPVQEKPEKNVWVLYCPYWGVALSEVHPLTHPANAEAQAQFEAWRRAAPDNLAIYDYNMYYCPSWDAMAAKVKWYAGQGVKGVWFCGMPTCFRDLFQAVVRDGLMRDPNLDPEKLKAAFVLGRYRAAAPAVLEYLGLVRERLAKGYPRGMHEGNMPAAFYLDDEFIQSCIALFEKMKDAAAGDAKVRAEVERERDLLLGDFLAAVTLGARGPSPAMRELALRLFKERLARQLAEQARQPDEPKRREERQRELRAALNQFANLAVPDNADAADVARQFLGNHEAVMAHYSAPPPPDRAGEAGAGHPPAGHGVCRGAGADGLQLVLRKTYGHGRTRRQGALPDAHADGVHAGGRARGARDAENRRPGRGQGPAAAGPDHRHPQRQDDRRRPVRLRQARLVLEELCRGGGDTAARAERPGDRQHHPQRAARPLLVPARGGGDLVVSGEWHEWQPANGRGKG